MTNLATTDKMDLVEQMAAEHSLNVDDFWNTMQQMCGCPEATRENFIGLLLQARKYNLDPMSRQLYLMKTKKGVQVITPIDGYLVLMNRHPDFVSFTVEEMLDDKFNLLAAKTTIYRKAQVAANLPPFVWTEWMAECLGRSGPWQSHPRRMLKHKSVSQAARYCFPGYIPDEDEWARADEVAAGALNETPQARDAVDSLKARLAESVDAPAVEIIPPPREPEMPAEHTPTLPFTEPPY